jgi:hypothetical protein
MVFVSVPDSETEQLEAHTDWNVLSSLSHRFMIPVGINGPVVHPCIYTSPTRVPAGVRASRDSHLDQIDQAVHAGTELCAPASQQLVARARGRTLSSTTTAHLTPNYPPEPFHRLP